MKNVFLTIVLLLGFTTAFAADHEFYNSMTKVEYNSGSNVMKLNIKLDAEHLEKALGVKSTDAKFDAELEKYLKENFKIKVNGVEKSLEYEKHTPSGEMVWVYFHISGVDAVTSIEITNAMLISTFPQQQNLVNLNINNKRENFTCKKGNETGKANF